MNAKIVAEKIDAGVASYMIENFLKTLDASQKEMNKQFVDLFFEQVELQRECFSGYDMMYVCSFCDHPGRIIDPNEVMIPVFACVGDRIVDMDGKITYICRQCHRTSWYKARRLMMEMRE